MTSKILKSVVADSNVLLSAVIGKAALKIFIHTDLKIITTSFNAREVEEYLPFLASKYDLDIKQLWVQFKMLPIQIIEAGEYESQLPFAQEHLAQRDFENIPHLTVYPTAKLLKLFHL